MKLKSTLLLLSFAGALVGATSAVVMRRAALVDGLPGTTLPAEEIER